MYLSTLHMLQPAEAQMNNYPIVAHSLHWSIPTTSVRVFAFHGLREYRIYCFKSGHIQGWKHEDINNTMVCLSINRKCLEWMRVEGPAPYLSPAWEMRKTKPHIACLHIKLGKYAISLHHSWNVFGTLTPVLALNYWIINCLKMLAGSYTPQRDFGGNVHMNQLAFWVLLMVFRNSCLSDSHWGGGTVLLWERNSGASGSQFGGPSSVSRHAYDLQIPQALERGTTRGSLGGILWSVGLRDSFSCLWL